MRITRRVRIEADPGLVWDVITDLRRAKEWAPGFEDYPYISEHWPRTGADAVWRYHAGPMRMDFRLEMTESLRGQSLQIGNRSGFGVGTERYRFSFNDGVTTIDYEASSKPSLAGRLLGPLLQRRLERQVDTTISNLKRYCELKGD